MDSHISHMAKGERRFPLKGGSNESAFNDFADPYTIDCKMGYRLQKQVDSMAAATLHIVTYERKKILNLTRKQDSHGMKKLDFQCFIRRRQQSTA